MSAAVDEWERAVEAGLSAIILDTAREAVVEWRVDHVPWMANEIRLSPEDFEQVAAIKAREIRHGIRPTLMGLYAVSDDTVPPGHFVIH